MMPEISLNILDVAQNSITAGATLIEISVIALKSEDTLTVVIEDNGCGMNEEQVKRVTDPFYTTRKTRKVGLGIPFFKLAAESTGGSFVIESTLGKGTRVEAVFGLSHIDRMPLGDINSTIHTLIHYNTGIDFLYKYQVDERGFELDTREFKKILGDVELDSYEVSEYIKEYLSENKTEVDNGLLI